MEYIPSLLHSTFSRSSSLLLKTVVPLGHILSDFTTPCSLLPQVSSPVNEKFSNWLTSTVPHIPIIFLGDLNNYIDDQDHTLACFLTSSLLASLSTIHSHICTLDFVIYTNYTTSKISVPSTLARPWLSIFPNHSLHYLLSRNSSIQNGFSLILPFSTNTPLIPLAYILSPNHHLNSLAPSPSHFPVILYRKFSQKFELHSLSISFLSLSQTGFCHHTNKTAPVKVTSNFQLAKPVSNVSVILFNLLAALRSTSSLPSWIIFFPWLLRYHTLLFFWPSLPTPLSQTSLNFFVSCWLQRYVS